MHELTEVIKNDLLNVAMKKDEYTIQKMAEAAADRARAASPAPPPAGSPLTPSKSQSNRASTLLPPAYRSPRSTSGCALRPVPQKLLVE